MSRPRTAALPAIAATVAVLLLGGGGAADADPVDDERLRAAEREPGAWLSYGRGYLQQRFSPLAEIDQSSIRELRPAWIAQTGIASTFQATPLVADGVMYVSAPGGHVLALDAATGEERWRYTQPPPERGVCCGLTNRGVALGYGKVFVATPDARLVALGRDSGAVVWVAALAEENTALGAAMAPLVAAGQVIVGVTGAGYARGMIASGNLLDGVEQQAGKRGGRGYLVALDAATGKEQWRWYSIPETGWEGGYVAETPGGTPLHRDPDAERARAADYPDAWAGGGASVWTTPAYDPALGLLYVGTGNAAPQFDGQTRPGDNLYASSVVALDIASGARRWHFQQVPHDLWGYDVASPVALFDWEGPQGRRKALGQAGKTGWLYVLDRESGELLVRSEPFVPQRNLFAPLTPEGVTIAPGPAGGASWSPIAVDPVRNLAFVAALHLPMRYTRHPSGTPGAPDTFSARPQKGEASHGTLTAIDLSTGAKRWQSKTPDPLVGGVLATAGGVVFTGEGRGVLSAFHSETGERLWEFRCGAGVNAPPVSYKAAGRQYIAVAAGGHKLFGFPLGDAVIAFALAD